MCFARAVVERRALLGGLFFFWVRLEYEAAHPGAFPQLIFGTMQSGQKRSRWAMVQPAVGGGGGEGGGTHKVQLPVGTSVGTPLSECLLFSIIKR